MVFLGLYFQSDAVYQLCLFPFLIVSKSQRWSDKGRGVGEREKESCTEIHSISEVDSSLKDSILEIPFC